MLFTFQGYKMKRSDKDVINDAQAALFYAINKLLSLEEYCTTLDYSKAATINFDKWAKKEGFAYDYATKANWDYRYEKFKKEKIEMFRKKKEEKKEEKKDSFLAKAQKFLKECYDRGATIEYEEAEGKWVDLPEGLPIDFSKFDEGKIRLKVDHPTYEQVEQFKKEYGNPIVTDWDLKNIPMLPFCLVKGFCRVLPTKVGNRLEWDSISIWRYYGKKEYLPETPITELQEIFKKVETEEQNTRNKMLESIMKEMKGLTDQATVKTFTDVMNYVRWEFHNLDEKIEDLYARTEE